MIFRPHNLTGGYDWNTILKPNTDPTITKLRCGSNATDTGNLAKTVDIRAGDTVGFGVGLPDFKFYVRHFPLTIFKSREVSRKPT